MCHGGRVVSLLLVATVMLSACGGSVKAPVVVPGEQKRGPVKKPDYYVVRRGDTLYSIAWNYGLDYRDVSRWNGIGSPYTIYPGQRIKLKPAPGQARAGTGKSQARDSKPSGSGKQIRPRKTGQQKKPQKSSPAGGPSKWLWPTTGQIVNSDTPISKNGIDISGKLNQRINASADGQVVYSGSGLLGYGKLIIIKHDEVYLSAYAHNNRLLVKEGERVAAGQHISTMGKTSNGRILLHFEIRKNGQPDNPLRYLPPR